MNKFFILTGLIFTHLSYAQCEDFSQTVGGTNPTCFEYNDGSVSAIISGGTIPYEIEIRDASGYLVNPFGEYETGFLLEDGWYYSYIMDSEGCELYDSIRLDDPIPLSIETTTIVDPSNLDECDGSITIGEVLGVGDVFTYIWSPDPDDISGVEANVFTNACALTYSLTVINEFGCTTSSDIEVGADLSVATEKYESIKVYSQNREDIMVFMTIYHTDANITLYDITGKMLSTHPITSEKMILPKPQTTQVLYSISFNGEVIKNGHLSLMQ